MGPVISNYEVQNEYTRPLEGMPYYQNSGYIYALGRNEERYVVSRIDFERYDEQNFQYIFSPEWGVIDALPDTIFQGIPGLDMSLRLERYYRVNMTPYFISERTPGEGREDVLELLEAVGLEYYERFEWRLRTDMRCGTDNLIVERAGKPRYIYLEENTAVLENLSPDDCVEIKDLYTAAVSGRQLRTILLAILRSGAKMESQAENRILSKEECSTLFRVLMAQEMLDAKRDRDHRREGIEKARKDGKYTGRKRIEIDPDLLYQIAQDFTHGRITEEEAMKHLKIMSRSTFYRRLKEIRQCGLED